MHCRLYKYKTKKYHTAALLLFGFIYCSATDNDSPSKGLKFALLGDSMTWIGGDSCEKATGWSHILMESGKAESIGMYARSGATWTNTSQTKRDPYFYSEVLHDNNVVYNQAIRLINDYNKEAISSPDCIVIFAGANDAWFANRRPGIYDSWDNQSRFSEETDPASITTLAGSVALVCELLNEYFPNSLQTVVTPLQMSKVSAEIIHNASDIIESAAISKGCTVLRADKEVGITHEVESTSPTFTSDGVHTNPDGARLVGNYILTHLPDKRSNKN